MCLAGLEVCNSELSVTTRQCIALRHSFKAKYFATQTTMQPITHNPHTIFLKLLEVTSAPLCQPAGLLRC